MATSATPDVPLTPVEDSLDERMFSIVGSAPSIAEPASTASAGLTGLLSLAEVPEMAPLQLAERSTLVHQSASEPAGELCSQVRMMYVFIGDRCCIVSPER